jgi:hypothetical protein
VADVEERRRRGFGEYFVVFAKYLDYAGMEFFICGKLEYMFAQFVR